MENESKTNAIRHRFDLKKVAYATIPNHILLSDKLSSDAKVLLMAIINSADNWSISLEYYRKLFGWSKRKKDETSKELQNKGFLKKKQYPKGKGIKGAKYYYIVSEFGNLKNEQDSESKMAEPEVQPNEEPVQEPTIVEPIVEDDEPSAEQITSIQDELNVLYTQDQIDEVGGKIADFINTGQLTQKNFDINKIQRFIQKQKSKFEADIIQYTEQLIAEGIDGRNKEIRDGIKFKLKKWVKDEIANGYLPTPSEIKAYKLQITSAKKGSNTVDAESHQN